MGQTTTYQLPYPEAADPADVPADVRELAERMEVIHAQLAAQVAAFVPAGFIGPYAGAAAPTGWLLCEGQAISRTTYAALFAAIGTAYGAGDGSTTFNVPNLKGRVPAGRDTSQTEFDTLGETGGAKTHVLDAAQMPQHSHVVNGHNHGGGWHAHTASAGGMIGTATGNAWHSHGLAIGYNLVTNDVAGGGSTNKVTGVPVTGGNAVGSGSANAENIEHQHPVTVDAGWAGIGTESPATDVRGSGQGHPNLQPYQVTNYIVKT